MFMNGPQIVEWMQENFDLNSSETVAIMGVHALGKFNKRQTALKYTWTAREEHMLNNQYYRNMMNKDDWHVDDNECTPVGTAYRKRPHGKFMAKMNQMTKNGGPIQWVQYKHTCPNCKSLENLLETYTGAWGDWDEDKKAEARACCAGLPDHLDCWPDNNRSSDSDSVEADDDVYGGCEQWRIIRGRESTMLNTDMGLYLDFEVNEDDGKPMGCPGLEKFTTEWLDKQHNKEIDPDTGEKVNGAWQSHIGYKANGDPKWWQNCSLQEWSQDAGGKPLHEIVEGYAEDEDQWIYDFFSVMTKMLSNGYPGVMLDDTTTLSLTDAPDHWKINEVTCDWPLKVDGASRQRQVTCTDSRNGLTATSTSTFKVR